MNLKPSEVRIWESYRYKYGPMTPVRMYDFGAAMVAAQINNAHGGKAKPKDFMPYFRQEETEDVVVDEKQFLSLLMTTGKAKVRNGKRR